jgi:hypothetical protein
VLVDEVLHTFAYDSLAFLEIKLVLVEGDPWIRTGTAHKNVIAVFQIAQPQVARRTD